MTESVGPVPFSSEYLICWHVQTDRRVDDITAINDLLSVSENHILEDLNRCVMALREADAEVLDRTAGVVRGRSVRVCSVVYAETDLYEPDEVSVFCFGLIRRDKQSGVLAE